MIQKNKIKTIVFRFLKSIAIILVILCFLIYFLNRGIKSKYRGFKSIDMDSIENIVIYRFNDNTINHYQNSMILSKIQSNRFASKWNNSYPIGLCKYIPKFTLTMRMKNGDYRYFRISGQTIKEKNAYGFKFICDNDFFETIMKRK